VFIDLGGVDGLVTLQIKLGTNNHPRKLLKLDETIKVVVTAFEWNARDFT